MPNARGRGRPTTQHAAKKAAAEAKIEKLRREDAEVVCLVEAPGFLSVAQFYDDFEPLDDAALLESAIRGMVNDLDAHSQYLDADEYRDIRISTTGSYTGVGVEVGENLAAHVDRRPSVRQTKLGVF